MQHRNGRGHDCRRDVLRITIALVLSGVFSLTPTLSPASELGWPTIRHDQQRTGRATGAGRIVSPTITWSLHLGGRLRAPGVSFHDLTDDGSKECIIIQGGRVLALDGSGRTIWISGSFGISRVLGFFDLDRDGDLELLASREGRLPALFILEAHTGTLLWSFDDFDEGAKYLGRREILIADLEADGSLEVFLKPGFSPQLLSLSFSAGFAADPRDNLLWEERIDGYHNYNFPVLGDADNDGAAELLFLQHAYLTVVDPADGSIRDRFNDVLFSHSFGLVQIANTDADPQHELIAIGVEHYDYSVTVFDIMDGAVSWQYQWYPTDGKGVVATENSVVDLDGDGAMEIVIGVYDDTDDERTTTGSTPGDHDGIDLPDQWTLLVLDAATGVPEAHLTNAYLRGITDLDGDMRPEILVQTVPSGSLSVGDFGTLQACELNGNLLARKWSLDNAALATLPPPVTPSRNPAGLYHRIHSVAAQDFDSDSVVEPLVFIDRDQDGQADRLRVYAADVVPPRILAELAIPSNESISILSTGNDLSGPHMHGQTAIYRSSGFLEVLNPDLTPATRFSVGGFSSAPLAVDLDGDEAVEIVANLSNSTITVLDPSTTRPGTPPASRWSYYGVSGNRTALYQDSVDSGYDPAPCTSHRRGEDHGKTNATERAGMEADHRRARTERAVRQGVL